MSSSSKPAALVLCLALVVAAACSDQADGGGGSAAAPAGDDAGSTERRCAIAELGDGDAVAFTGEDPVAVALDVARRTHECAPTVVLAPAADPWAATIAAPIAIAEAAPLLLTAGGDGADVAAALDELETDDVVAVGVHPGAGERAVTVLAGATSAPDDAGKGNDAADAGTAPRGVDRTRLTVEVLEHLEAERAIAVHVDDVEARAALGGHLDDGVAVLPVPADDGALEELAAALPEDLSVEALAHHGLPAAALVRRLTAAGVDAELVDAPLWPEGEVETAWLVDRDQPGAVAVAAATAAVRGDALFDVEATDLRAGRERTARLRAASPVRTVLVGEVTPHAEWQLPVVLEGPRLPGGGFRLFEDRVVVALYGHPGAGSLGALGQQDLDASVDRARGAAAPYAADGRDALPGFEIITTIASSAPGPTGDYSSRTSIDALRPWVDRAAEEGLYVVLDLQPGHTDFLTQAREYEELLREPHVGLALDPEWRLKPGERHLRQIGSVSGAEVQTVVDWLAELTRANRLPEKLLLLHQFRLSMLPDRDQIEQRPELAMVVHMDGWGTLDLKDGSYRAVTSGAEDRWLWGWKNFYVDDTPLAPPERTMSLEPQPVFVSYQ